MSENQTELNSDVTTPKQEETLDNEPVFEEQERIPEPWENAPEGLVYYNKIYEDGHLGTHTQSAKLAYDAGFFENAISENDIELSDVDNRYYLKSKCPHKTEEDLLKDQYRLEIAQLKKQLSDTDYKAIKYAEGQISEEEYASVRAERQGYRDRINYLEGLL